MERGEVPIVLLRQRQNGHYPGIERHRPRRTLAIDASHRRRVVRVDPDVNGPTEMEPLQSQINCGQFQDVDMRPRKRPRPLSGDGLTG